MDQNVEGGKELRGEAVPGYTMEAGVRGESDCSARRTIRNDEFWSPICLQ